MKTETCIAIFAAFWAIVIVLWAIGGLDDGSARVLPETTPHGVHGTLKKDAQP